MASKEDLFGKQKSFMFAANFAGVCTSTVIELTLGMLFLSRPICCRCNVVFCGPGTVTTYGSLLLETELPQSLSILMSCHFIKTCTKILSLEAKYPIEENIHLGIIGEILVHEQNAGFYGEKDMKCVYNCTG